MAKSHRPAEIGIAAVPVSPSGLSAHYDDDPHIAPHACQICIMQEPRGNRPGSASTSTPKLSLPTVLRGEPSRAATNSLLLFVETLPAKARGRGGQRESGELQILRCSAYNKAATA